MVSLGGSVRPGSISTRDAIRELHQRVTAAAQGEVDPAPWHDVSSDLIEMWSEGDEAGFVRRKKLEERSKLVMQRSLLSGALRAHFSDGRESHDVPGWAWIGAERNENVWFEGRLPLEVLLPDNWQRWSCHTVHLDRDAFIAWADSLALDDADWLPTLPAAHDENSKPEPITNRTPPDAPFVTLSEALTWIAFGISLDRDRLDRAISGHSFDRDPQADLADAMEKLAVQASGGQIAMRGKYLEGDCDDENKVLTAPIDPVRFEDFAQFDILYDGLRYGTGLTWWNTTRGIVDRLFDGSRRDAFRAVKVNRADLLREFPPGDSSEGPPTMIVMPMPDGWGRADCAELPPWLNPYQLVAWVQYRDVAIVAKADTFNGLAARHMYETEPQVGSVVDLERALQEGRLTSYGLTKSGETFAPIPAVEWTRIALAPLDTARQHPYLHIQVKRDDALAVFPRSEASSGHVSVSATSTAGAENECRKWLAGEFAADSEKRRSKDNFRQAALVRFAGRLSVRGFNDRVWPSLASEDGRNEPGAKKKS